MAKNKAFVRYANNKAVPGSLIVRKKAPSVGTWKEVPADLCCNSGGNCLYGSSFNICLQEDCDSVESLLTTRTYYLDIETQDVITCANKNLYIGLNLYTDTNKTLAPDNAYINVSSYLTFHVENGIIINIACP